MPPHFCAGSFIYRHLSQVPNKAKWKWFYIILFALFSDLRIYPSAPLLSLPCIFAIFKGTECFQMFASP